MTTTDSIDALENKVDLTEAERKMLMGPVGGVHVTMVWHRAEFHSLQRKGLIDTKDQSR